MSVSAVATTRVRPKRSVSAAANGAEFPNTSRLTEAAAEIALWLHANSSIIGSMRTPNVARIAAAARSAMNPAAATNQARCMARHSRALLAAPRVAETPMFDRFLPHGVEAFDPRRAAAPRWLGVLRHRHGRHGLRAE